MTVDDRSFSAFVKVNAEEAKHFIGRVRDVTGHRVHSFFGIFSQPAGFRLLYSSQRSKLDGNTILKSCFRLKLFILFF
jgi:hypothetical protein